MIKSIRKTYNKSFSTEKYNSFIDDLNKTVGHDVKFRVAETPVFIDKIFKNKLIEAGTDVMSILFEDNFEEISRNAIPNHLNVPNQDKHPLFVCVDFAVCKDKEGALTPQLIEFQGFPSLFYWQELVANKYVEHFDCPKDFTFLFNNLSSKDYFDLLEKSILNGHKQEEVVLLELKPHEQKTNVDFYVTESKLGIKPVCLSDVFAVDNKLYYKLNGANQQIKRIYNRVIFDELEKTGVLYQYLDFTKPYEVEWAEHPNWFFRISKYTMPYLKSKYVPETKYLHEFEVIPSDLENYVLKPLFSFSGQGVIFNVKPSDIEAIKDKTQFILQKKVEYAPVIESPNGMVKCEVRLLYIWPPNADKPILASNLSRLSKGEMIGVRYNEHHDWVGGSVCLMEP